jgi:iron complex transport system substrate-binding protein
VDRREAATQRVAEIRRAEARVARVRASTASARVLLVLQRDPIFVAGPGSFIAEMVSALGAQNIAAELGDAYPRVATEWVVDRAPEILIDLSPDNAAAQSYWSRWPSIPAVRDGRVIAVDAELISMPGPHLDRSLAVLGEALYGESIAAQIRGDAPKRDAARP